MTAKQTTDIAEAMEKLGYEILSIKEEREVPEFKPMLIHITLNCIGAKPSRLK